MACSGISHALAFKVLVGLCGTCEGAVLYNLCNFHFRAAQRRCLAAVTAAPSSAAATANTLIRRDQRGGRGDGQRTKAVGMPLPKLAPSQTSPSAPLAGALCRRLPSFQIRFGWRKGKFELRTRRRKILRFSGCFSEFCGLHVNALSVRVYPPLKCIFVALNICLVLTSCASTVN